MGSASQRLWCKWDSVMHRRGTKKNVQFGASTFAYRVCVRVELKYLSGVCHFHFSMSTYWKKVQKKKKKGQKSYKVWESICILKDLVNPTVLRSEEFQKWFNLILQVAALCWAQNLHCSENSDADLFFYFFHSEVAHSGNREQRTDGAYPGNDSYRWNIRGRKNIRSICIKYVSIDVPWIAQTVSSILSN